MTFIFCEIHAKNERHVLWFKKLQKVVHSDYDLLRKIEAVALSISVDECKIMGFFVHLNTNHTYSASVFLFDSYTVFGKRT